MFKEVLQSINGVGIYAIISLIIFILFFVVIILRLIRMDKNFIIKMERLPLDPKNNSLNLKDE